MATRILTLERGAMDLRHRPENVATNCLIVDRRRFRLTIGQGISLDRSRMIWLDRFADILHNGLLGGLLTKTLREHGMSVAGGDEWASVLTALSHDDARLKGRQPGDPMLFLRRLTRASDGSVIEYVENTLDPDLLGLHIVF